MTSGLEMESAYSGRKRRDGKSKKIDKTSKKGKKWNGKRQCRRWGSEWIGRGLPRAHMRLMMPWTCHLHLSPKTVCLPRTIVTFLLYYWQDRPQGSCQYLNYSQFDFDIFDTKGATCGNNHGEIWHGCQSWRSMGASTHSTVLEHYMRDKPSVTVGNVDVTASMNEKLENFVAATTNSIVQHCQPIFIWLIHVINLKAHRHNHQPPYPRYLWQPRERNVSRNI